ncbi:DUF481 domain-containing protein [Allomuricauda sp. SCSIO 65647]|uniref:DUF481 domain-containing protein n=1 Tax=Allomuricauda sp. SCSIO 65647 TaxID=2908843 RepID=UPI001F3FB688|nr:DUF481 domain-containing protein [Muricauda sp. SCSIO 65647]UJH66588.1 DUF481 domain-containing protein [Muricauda sp. SCSIO 65647]
MYRLKTLIIVVFVALQAQGQIVNVESLRKVTDTSKWSGNVGVDLSLIKNRNDIFKITNRTHLQYQNKKNLFLVVTNLNFQQLDSSKFVNSGTIHLRYNYKFKPKMAWEFFTQSQYDAISNIDFRGLMGTGPRFKFGTSEEFKFYMGTLVMYEYEKSTETFGTNINRDIRGSAYLSFSLYPSSQVSVVSTTYYQPRLSAFRDYRISSETSLAFEIFKGLGFRSTFSLLFDAFPPSDIPQTQYTWTNGIVYTFD